MPIHKKNGDSIARKIPQSPEEKAVHQKADLESSESVTWRIFRIMSEFVSGFQFIAKYKRTVSVFGSARLPEGSRYYLEAVELTRKLANSGFNIVTGGGPGIMEAANRGAHESGKTESIGLNIQLPFEQRINPYVTRGIGFHYFFTRKVMLSASGQAYVYFPGGFGTLDEFFEVITLIQTGKMERIPIVLYGKEFWEPLATFFHKTLVKEFKTIDMRDTELYTIVDSVADAYKVIKRSKERTDF